MNLFELFIKIGVDDQASDKISTLSSKFGKGLQTAAKIGTAAVGATAAGITALTKAAVDNYAEYEQLVGGVDTLFKNSSQKVQKYAANAYKTAGMSANEYMSTVTSFSASLLQSLGGDTDKAAEYANQALTDMSDNANKMGTSMEMIQNAYQGFAKQNYTMLDNLKLGYGGTQEEMKRLIADAAELSDTVDAQDMSFANIVKAINVVQTEMGITGTTAKEAGSTIQGSVGMMKSSWENLVTGIADENANIDVLMDNFLASVGTVADNILPVVERILGNVFNSLADNAPEMLKKGIELFMQIAIGAIRAIPGIIDSIPEIIDSIADGFVEAWPEIVEIGKDIVRGLWEGIQSLAGWIGEKVSGFFDGLFDGAKKHEEIHSPSKKWAEIGKYDALGFGAGWDSEFSDVKRGITNGLDFGVSTISSGQAKSGGYLAYNGGENLGDIVINITEEIGGEKIARKQYRYNIAEAKRRGVHLVNA